MVALRDYKRFETSGLAFFKQALSEKMKKEM